MDIFDKLDAICAEAITDPKTFKKFDRLLTTDFVDIVGKNYNVITIKNNKEDFISHVSKSKYIYVFNEPKGTHKIREGELQSIIHLTSTWFYGITDIRVRNNTIRRLTEFEKRGLILLTKDSNNDVLEVKLNNCILLIRLSDHELDPDADDNTRNSFNARRNLVDSVYYYNVDDEEKPFNLNINKATYCLFKKGKERIIYEFSEKMRNAGLSTSIINEIIKKVNNIFR